MSLSALVPDRSLSHVSRLFPGFKGIERDYSERTDIVPAMHTVGLGADVHAAQPWVAGAVYETKDPALVRLFSNNARSLPWLLDHVEEARATVGEDS